MLTNLQDFIVLNPFKRVFMLEISQQYHKLVLSYIFCKTKQGFMARLGSERAETQTDSYWFGLPFPVSGRGVEISVMQQSITA